MSRFHNRKESAQIENMRPKGVQNVTKCLPEQRVANRAPLQCLGEQKQKKEVKPEKKEMKSTAIYQDVFKLKSVFTQRTLLRFQSTETREYEEEIWSYMCHLEKSMLAHPGYMSKQTHLTWEMRSILVDWLATVASEYKMNGNTIHLTVNYLDRFLNNISVIREKLQLVGATAMMIAGKVEDIYPPDTKEWSYLTGDAFTVRQFLKMEQLMLKILEFKMNAPTTFDFLQHLCVKHSVDKKTKYLAMYFSELVLLEGKDYLRYFPSKLAAASLLLARHTLSKPQVWTEKMQETSGYSLKQLSPVVEKQQKTFQSSPFKEQQSIQKKYASEKYQRVALLKPRVLILDED